MTHIHVGLSAPIQAIEVRCIGVNPGRDWGLLPPDFAMGKSWGVVIRVQEPKQTKESARRDGAAVARLLCGHMFLLCALGHMFLLCGAGPYVSIGWLWAWG